MLTKNMIVRIIGILLIVILSLGNGVFSKDNVVYAQDDGGTISGTVTEEGTDEAIEGILVFACEVDVYCDLTYTDSDGFYEISLPPGTYRVGAHPETDYVPEFYDDKFYWDEADDVFVTAGQETRNINFTLLPARSISGTVTEDGGAALAGMMVEACDYESGWDGPCFYGETEMDGSYTIFGVPVGTYRVHTGWEGNWVEEYYPDTTDWELAEPVEVKLDTDTSGIDFALVLGGSISGTITDEEGNPLSSDENIDISVCLFDDDSVCWWTDVVDGSYLVTGLPYGDYRVHAYQYPQGFWIDEYYKNTSVWEEAQPVKIKPINGQNKKDKHFNVTGIDFALTLSGSISGRVTTTDENDNKVPVVGLWVDTCHESVSLDMWGSSPLCNGAETDNDGYYTITHLLPGNYRVVTWGTDELSFQFYDGVLNYYEASLVTVEPGIIKDGFDFSLFASGPAFNAWPVEDYVDGWGWDINEPVTLVISTGYTEVLYPFYPDWSPETTWVISQGEFDLQPGDTVTLDNGIYTKKHTVTGLEITSTDLSNSSVSGTAESGSHVYVWYYTDDGRVDRHEVADDSGNWTANFSVPGDEPGEEQTYMIPAGAGGEANQVDFDGDGTQVNWWMQGP